jgi:hypothetical protein
VYNLEILRKKMGRAEKYEAGYLRSIRRKWSGNSFSGPYVVFSEACVLPFWPFLGNTGHKWKFQIPNSTRLVIGPNSKPACSLRFEAMESWLLKIHLSRQAP